MRFFDGNEQGARRRFAKGFVPLGAPHPVGADAAGEDVGNQQIIQVGVVFAKAEDDVAAMFQLVYDGADGVAGRLLADIIPVIDQGELAV